MDADEIAQFLKTHPQFFDQYPQLIESIYVPHPHGGRAIPLTERQIVSLREKVRVLEAKIAEFLRIGEDNDAIGEKVHRLSLALLGAKDAPAAKQALHFHLQEDFAVPHVALKLWTSEGVDAELREKAEGMGAPQCGAAAGSPFLGWFGEAADHLRSIALIPLGQTRSLGLLLLGSEDPQRFFAEMGTLYLRRIGELTAGVIAART